MDQLQRVQFVVKRYPHLQGLRLVPLGLLFLASGAWRAGYLQWWPGAANAVGARWFAGALVVAMLIAVALERYYQARFGSVQPLPNVGRVFAAVGFAAILAVAVWLQLTLRWPISAPFVVVGAALGYIGVAGGYTRAHYVAVAAACVLFASLGTLGVPLHIRLVLLDYLIGGGLIAVGIGDHLFLRKTLEPYPHVRTV